MRTNWLMFRGWNHRAQRRIIMDHELALNIFLIVGFLAVAVSSSVVLKKIHFPFTIGLVVIGYGVGILALKLNYVPLVNINLTPEIILYLILPTLIYDAAINMDIKALRKNILPILLLAVVGLLLSAGLIGGTLNHTTHMGIGAALLFGALISATDPVAVIALFSEIGAPRRLVTLVDGESIFNDATAIVLFTIVLATINSGVSTLDVLFLDSVVRFLLVMVGGLLTGTVVGVLGGMVVRAQKDNGILHITISLMMAYISFIAADQLHVSGVMSTMAAGIVVSLLTDNVIKHEDHHFLVNFWEFFSLVANSFVFILLGL
ncbi:MAG: cation:proton antiporter, partial [Kiritimatiellae bacterium]|nr:cation:proton antiporter [Kiritimatiellia bacterium]